MNSKFYVSLEAARLLREKGYDRECIFYYYDNSREVDYSFWGERNSTLEERCVSAPSKAEVIDWLESKGIVVVVYYFKSAWQYLLYPLLNEIEDRLLKKVFIKETYPTRLEAEDAAIIKALELL
jgi:hypothetical protein